MRLPHLDLAWSLRGKKYNKRAGRILIRDFRLNYFGKHKRLTKQRCEEFFSNDRNFSTRREIVFHPIGGSLTAPPLSHHRTYGSCAFEKPSGGYAGLAVGQLAGRGAWGEIAFPLTNCS